jgi:hypothetical protein
VRPSSPCWIPPSVERSDGLTAPPASADGMLYLWARSSSDRGWEGWKDARRITPSCSLLLAINLQASFLPLSYPWKFPAGRCSPLTQFRPGSRSHPTTNSNLDRGRLHSIPRPGLIDWRRFSICWTLSAAALRIKSSARSPWPSSTKSFPTLTSTSTSYPSQRVAVGTGRGMRKGISIFGVVDMVILLLEK